MQLQLWKPGGLSNGELQLGLLAIIERDFLSAGRGTQNRFPQQSCGKPRSLGDCALASQFLNSLQDEVDDLLANGVVLAGIVTGSIFLACDELLKVEYLVVGTSWSFISDNGF